MVYEYYHTIAFAFGFYSSVFIREDPFVITDKDLTSSIMLILLVPLETE